MKKQTLFNALLYLLLFGFGGRSALIIGVSNQGFRSPVSSFSFSLLGLGNTILPLSFNVPVASELKPSDGVVTLELKFECF